jgi:hypothetical protein
LAICGKVARPTEGEEKTGRLEDRKTGRKEGSGRRKKKKKKNTAEQTQRSRHSGAGIIENINND